MRPTLLALTLSLACASSASLVACQGGSAATPPPPLKGFDAARAWAHMEAQVALGPRPSGSEANRKLRDYLVAQLEALELRPVREAFTAEDAPGGPVDMENVFADFEGKRRGDEPAPMIVLGAHFDTKRMRFPFVGANDGASGVGALLELARVLTSHGPRDVTYRFLFLDGEEAIRGFWQDPDNCYGSRHHVKELSKVYGARKRIKAFILLDLVADKDLQLERDSNSSSQLFQLFTETAKRIGEPEFFAKRSNPIRDDHEQFKKANIPSIDLIDLHYGEVGNEYWHTEDDTLEHCSQESLGRVGRLMLAALPEVEAKYAK